MSVAEADIAFALDLFSDLGDLTSRKMFGGMCLYHQATAFAVQDNRATQFHNMPYWSVPDAALDDPQEACTLARRTIASLA
jgi:DNA transformation protein